MGEDVYTLTADKFIFTVKKGFLYSDRDVWIQKEGDLFRVGVTDFFQRRGGDVVFAELPQVGSKVTHLQEIARLETIKAVLSVDSPSDATIKKVNTMLQDRPEVINEDPYGEGWLVVMSPNNSRDLERLLNAEQYFGLMKTRLEDDVEKSKR